MYTDTINFKVLFIFLFLESPEITFDMQINGQTQSAPAGARTQNLNEVGKTPCYDQFSFILCLMFNALKLRPKMA